MHSHRHMLKYHVILPAVVLAVLLVTGVPLSSAASAALAFGCIAMMVMMGVMAVAAVLRIRPPAATDQEVSMH